MLLLIIKNIQNQSMKEEEASFYKKLSSVILMALLLFPLVASFLLLPTKVLFHPQAFQLVLCSRDLVFALPLQCLPFCISIFSTLQHIEFVQLKDIICVSFLVGSLQILPRPCNRTYVCWNWRQDPIRGIRLVVWSRLWLFGARGWLFGAGWLFTA